MIDLIIEWVTSQCMIHLVIYHVISWTIPGTINRAIQSMVIKTMIYFMIYHDPSDYIVS